MFTLLTRLTTLVVVCATSVALTGCDLTSLFGGSDYGGESTDFEADGNEKKTACATDAVSGTVSCVSTLEVRISDGFTQTYTSHWTFHGYDALFAFLDPIILQVPATATGFSGSIISGPGVTAAQPLSITAGLASVPIDAHTSLVAEPGMQLVVVDFPSPETVADGQYRFKFHYNGAGPSFKALSAAKVVLGGKAYYVPIFPCVTDFAAAPAIPIPLGGLDLRQILPLFASAQGCNGKTFEFAGVGSASVDVVEFYAASLDHYFITWVPAEIAILDAGVTIKGWTRTGKTFKTYTTAQTGTSQVCRFYIPPGLGDSHFFGRGKTECDDTAAKFPSLILEDPMFMQMFLPTAGACPAGTTQVYRVFSNRADANHRYMTDRALRDQMVAMGWLAEGDGPDLVVMCAPN